MPSRYCVVNPSPARVWQAIAAFVIAATWSAALAAQAARPGNHQVMPQLPGANHGPCGSCAAPRTLASSTVVVSSSEPGEPLDMTGILYRADGVTPASGMLLFVYHTDSRGQYNDRGDERDPRLRGWMRTGPDGRYRFRTIRPAPYPRHTIPAHIHATTSGPGCAERWVDDYRFEDDPLLTSAERDSAGARNASVVRLARDGAGVWHGTRDIIIACG